MGLFSKRKSEEELEEEMMEEEEELRKTRKKMRDLNPQNRKSRKEPIKPWTKADRYLVGGVFGATILIALVLFAFSTDFKLPGLPRIGLPKFGSGEITITANKEDREKAQKIKDEVNIETKKLSGTYGFYYIRLSDGYSFGLGESTKMNAASLMKLPVMVAYYQAYEKGEIDAEEIYVLQNVDKVKGSGSLINKPAGTKTTFRELINLMGKESDNTAMKIVSTKLGDTKINDVIKLAGMINTDYTKWETTPEDISELLKKIYKEEIVNSKSKEELLSNITETVYEDLIPKGINEDVRVAHKFGREIHILHDAGIIYSSNPYVLTVMSKGVIDDEAWEFIPEIVSKIHSGIGN